MPHPSAGTTERASALAERRSNRAPKLDRGLSAAKSSTKNTCARSLRGLPKKIGGGGVLDDLALVHEHHAVGDLAGEPHLVRDHHHGHALGRERYHDVEHLVDHLGVERRGRLVEQHGDGVHGERTGDRDALLLAAGQLARIFLGVRGEPDAIEPAACPVACSRHPRGPAP